MKKVMLGILVTSMLIFTNTTIYGATIQIEVDGLGIVSDAAPQIKNNRTMVPLRIISENLGAKVDWSSSQATLSKGDVQIILKPGSKEAIKNGQTELLDAITYVNNDRVMVPLRAIFESLNATVDYDDSTKTITGSQDDNLIILTIGEKVASVNGKKITLDVPAQIIMDLTVVPVRFISESLGASVVWADKIVFIESVRTEVKQPKSEIELLAGYIVIRDNTLHFDEVEIIEPEDKERIKELGLDEELPPTGFKILNEIKEEVTYELTDETVYNFLDVYRLFVEDENEDRAYATTKKDEFLKHLGEYNQNDILIFEQTIPYFIEVQDGKVISITEEFKFTI